LEIDITIVMLKVKPWQKKFSKILGADNWGMENGCAIALAMMIATQVCI
jgi:hypothetical protein